MKFRFPELALGIFLTVAVFSAGMIFSSPPPNTAARTTEHPETPDDRIANYTLWLAILTGGLVLVSAGQGYFLLRADRTARMSAEAAQAQTHNFTKLERPYIYVFNPEGLGLESDREDPFYFVKYQVANYGKTPATIDGVFAGISVGSLPDEPHQVGPWHELHASPIMTPDQKRTGLTVVVPETVAIGEYADEDTPPTPAPDLADDEKFFVRVLIKYHGPFSRGHETSVCWRWDSASLRLILFDNHAFNFTI